MSGIKGIGGAAGKDMWANIKKAFGWEKDPEISQVAVLAATELNKSPELCTQIVGLIKQARTSSVSQLVGQITQAEGGKLVVADQIHVSGDLTCSMSAQPEQTGGKRAINNIRANKVIIADSIHIGGNLEFGITELESHSDDDGNNEEIEPQVSRNPFPITSGSFVRQEKGVTHTYQLWSQNRYNIVSIIGWGGCG